MQSLHMTVCVLLGRLYRLFGKGHGVTHKAFFLDDLFAEL